MASIGASESLPQLARTRPSWVWFLIAALALGCLIVVSLIPTLFLVTNSFNEGSPGDVSRFGLQSWQEAFGSSKTLTAIGYSFLLLIRHPVSLAIAFCMAWVLVRVRIPFSGFIESSFWFAFFLPTLPMALSWMLLTDPNYGLLNRYLLSHVGLHFNPYSIWGITWVHMSTSTIPIMVILLIPMLRQVEGALDEAARVCGASIPYLLRRIILPIVAPGLLVVLIAGLMTGLESFQIEMLLGTPGGIFVFSTRIYDLITAAPERWGAAMALSTLFLGILLALALFHERFTAKRRFASITGRSAFRQTDIGRTKYVIAGMFLAYLAVTVLLPLAVLVLGASMKLFGFFDVPDPISFKHWESALTNPDFLTGLRTSLVLGLGVGLVSIPAYFVLAYLLQRTPMPWKSPISILAWLPFAVPGILLGLAFLWLLLSTPILRPLYGSLFGLIIVLVVQGMPLGVYLATTAFGQIGQELDDAGRVCGAGRFYILRRILLPLASPTMVTIFVLVFVGAMKAIDSVLFIGGSIRPLSLIMFEYAIGGKPEPAAIIGIILSLLALGVVLLSRRFGLQLRTG